MKRIGPLLLSVAVVLSACGFGDEGTDAVDGATDASAWARASAPTQTIGAVYFDLTVTADDTLLGASVPSSVAARAEIHEVVMETDDSTSAEGSGPMDEMDVSEGSDDMSDTDMNAGQMRMQELPDGLVLTGGETVSFEPGSFHVMLPDLVEPLEIGDEFELTLDFADADDVTITVQVAETAP